MRRQLQSGPGPTRLVLLLAFAALADALTHLTPHRHRAHLKPTRPRIPAIRMIPEDATAPNQEENNARGQEAEQAPSAYKTVYDDEMPPLDTPQISEAMKQKLIRGQRSLGADPNSGSPFLLVFGAVGVFVILGFLAVNT